jgi:hypothetical protein
MHITHYSVGEAANPAACAPHPEGRPMVRSDAAPARPAAEEIDESPRNTFCKYRGFCAATTGVDVVHRRFMADHRVVANPTSEF